MRPVGRLLLLDDDIPAGQGLRLVIPDGRLCLLAHHLLLEAVQVPEDVRVGQKAPQ